MSYEEYKNKYYKCYSYNQYKFLGANEVHPISSGINKQTDNRFFIYEMDDELSELLTAYTNHKNKR